MSTPTARRRPRRRIVLPLVAGCLAVAAVPALAGVTASDEADLAIAKTSDATAYAPGETIAYLITVTNAGEVAVPVADILVSDPQLADLTPAGGATDGALDPGESLDWAGTRATSAADCGPLENTATVELRGDKKGLRDANPANDSATHVVDVTGAACAPPVGVASVARAARRPAVPRDPGGHAPVRGRLLPRAAPARRRPGAARARRRRGRRVHGHRAQRRRGRRSPAAPSSPCGCPPASPSRAARSAPPWPTARWSGRSARWARARAAPISVTLRADRATAGRRALSATATARCGAARATALVRVAQAAQTQVRPAVAG